MNSSITKISLSLDKPLKSSASVTDMSPSREAVSTAQSGFLAPTLDSSRPKSTGSITNGQQNEEYDHFNQFFGPLHTEASYTTDAALPIATSSVPKPQPLPHLSPIPDERLLRKQQPKNDSAMAMYSNMFRARQVDSDNDPVSSTQISAVG